MKCKDCPARAEGKQICKIGVAPYKLLIGEQGCTYNSATIRKHLNTDNFIPAYRIVGYTQVKEAGDDEVYCMWYRCKKCGSDFIHSSFVYCPMCGRKIAWPK